MATKRNADDDYVMQPMFTYLGNKRGLLDFIRQGVEQVLGGCAPHTPARGWRGGWGAYPPLGTDASRSLGGMGGSPPTRCMPRSAGRSARSTFSAARLSFRG